MDMCQIKRQFSFCRTRILQSAEVTLSFHHVGALKAGSWPACEVGYIYNRMDGCSVSYFLHSWRNVAPMSLLLLLLGACALLAARNANASRRDPHAAGDASAAHAPALEIC
ncbi:hypothetical protein EVAR_35467_1 [Eumeta japonica]|uniref:Uncharacterized protein n=1 Tax=Eumeta variegata TaxID=151549 RepID=A0A4C1XJP0_EUMVA|nr:hypothetical protein EVAR_35467_1 [Eumeta japonica]